MHALRRVVRRARDKSRKTPPLVLSAAVAAAIVVSAAVPLTIIALLAPTTLTVVVVGLLSAATLAAVTAMWLHLSRQFGALRAANDRVEVTQRRILAAIEQERLDARRRSARSMQDIDETAAINLS